MKIRPILFRPHLIEAIVDGAKTQTRRIIKEIKPSIHNPKHWDYNFKRIAGMNCTNNSIKDQISFILEYSPNKIGDVLWVKESFFLDKNDCASDPLTYDTITYKANPTFHKDVKRPGEQYDHIDLLSEGWVDPDYPDKEYLKWTSPLFMKKIHARIFLQITRVRVQRLYDITNEDAILEGIEKYPPLVNTNYPNYKDYLEVGNVYIHPKNSFFSLWESINGNDSLHLNPWLWVYDFKVLSTTGVEAIEDNPIKQQLLAYIND